MGTPVGTGLDPAALARLREWLNCPPVFSEKLLELSWQLFERLPAPMQRLAGDQSVEYAEAVAAAARSVDIVRTQYLSGLTDFQRYLDSQRALTQQQDQLATSQGQVVRNLIALNKALGGGWRSDSEDPDLATTAESAETEPS